MGSEHLLKGEVYRKDGTRVASQNTGVWRVLDEQNCGGKRKTFRTRANGAMLFSSCSAPSQSLLKHLPKKLHRNQTKDRE
jgi:hypothetical protein